MNREDVIAVAVRLFAIYVLFDILKTIPGAGQLLSGPEGFAWTGLFIAILVVGGLFCAFLWFFPLSVARKLLPVMRVPPSEQMIGAPVALSLGLTLIGIWLLATALVDASYWVTVVVRSRQTRDMPVEWTPQQIASMVATAVQFVLSVLLVIGNAGVHRLVQRIRYGGLSNAP